MARRDDLDLRIRALVEGVREVQNLTEEVEELQREGRQDLPDNSARMRRGLKRTDREAEGLSRTMDRLRGVIAGVAGVATFTALANQAARAAQEIEQAQRQAFTLRTSTAEVQRLTFAFRQFGADASDIGDVLGQLSDRASEAVRGTASFVEAFEQIGISVDDLRGKEPIELLNLVADALQNTEDPTQRLAAASQLLGDEMANRLLPLLSQGSERLEELGNQAERVGAVLNEEQAQNVAAMNREFRALRETLDAQFTQAMGEFSDELHNAAEAVNLFLGGGTTAEQLERIRGILAAREGERGLFAQLRSAVGVFRGGGIPTEDLREAERVLQQRLERQQRSVSGIDPELRALFAGSAPSSDDDDGGFVGRRTTAIRLLTRHSMSYLDAAQKIDEASREAGDSVEDMGRRGTNAIRLLDRKTLSYLDALEKINEQSDETGDELSQFAIQAARSMQSAFADFLFDPFEDGLEGLADQFVITLRRMAAEAAAANIMESVFGGGEGGGSANAGFAQFIASLFGEAHTGGVVGKTAFPQRSASPLAWAGAPRMHMGGIAGDEVPIIARRGEEILTQDNPRHRDNAGAGGTTIVQNITTPDAQSFRRSRSALRRDAQLAMGRG